MRPLRLCETGILESCLRVLGRQLVFPSAGGFQDPLTIRAPDGSPE